MLYLQKRNQGNCINNALEIHLMKIRNWYQNQHVSTPQILADF